MWLCVGEWNTIRCAPCLYRDRETETYTYIQLYEVDMMMVQREIYPRYQHPPHCSHNAWSDDETDDGGKVVGWEGAACFRLVAGDHDLHQQHLITNTAEEFS